MVVFIREPLFRYDFQLCKPIIFAHRSATENLLGEKHTIKELNFPLNRFLSTKNITYLGKVYMDGERNTLIFNLRQGRFSEKRQNFNLFSKIFT